MKILKSFYLIGIIFIFYRCNSGNYENKSQNSTPIVPYKLAQDFDTIEAIKSVKMIIHLMEENNKVDAENIGFAATTSIQWKLYKQLLKYANENQLLKYTDHKNGVVRCYAFQALAFKKSKYIMSVLIKHLTDTTTIYYQSCDLINNMFVGDYFLDVVTPHYIDQTVYKLNKSERSIIDSLLINNDNIFLYAKWNLLSELKPDPKNYNRIKELVISNRDESALIALAKFKNKDDLEIIASFFDNDKSEYFALWAAREFPDIYFYPYILKVFDDEWKICDKIGYDDPKWRMCYQALAKYPINETMIRFKKTINIKDESKYNCLCSNLLIAIKKYPNKLFEPLKKKIVLSEEYLNDVKMGIDSDS